jgi:hypothetical protein
MVVWRYTYGFSRKSHAISESFISKATGICKRYISSELNKLIELKVINLISPSTYTSAKVISFNKNYDEWVNCRTIIQEANNPSTVEELQDTTKETYEHFEKLWELYPKKKGKGSVSDSKKKELYKISFEEMSRAIERYKEDIRANNTEEQYIKYGSTFFNSGYVDYLDVNYKQTSSLPLSVSQAPTNPEYLKARAQIDKLNLGG